MVSRGQLTRQVLSCRVTPYDRSIDIHIRNIRCKLAPVADAVSIGLRRRSSRRPFAVATGACCHARDHCAVPAAPPRWAVPGAGPIRYTGNSTDRGVHHAAGQRHGLLAAGTVPERTHRTSARRDPLDCCRKSGRAGHIARQPAARVFDLHHGSMRADNIDPHSLRVSMRLPA